MEQFETKVTINKETFRELRKHMKPPREKIRVAILSVWLVLFGIGLMVFRPSDMSGVLVGIGLFAIIFGLAGPFLHHLNFHYVTKINQRRVAESAGGKTTIEYTASFTEDEIKIYFPTSEGTAHIKYDAIRRFAETARWYALFTKENQFIVVDKLCLVQAQKSEAFLRFLKEKCNKVRWRK